MTEAPLEAHHWIIMGLLVVIIFCEGLILWMLDRK